MNIYSGKQDKIHLFKKITVNEQKFNNNLNKENL